MTANRLPVNSPFTPTRSAAILGGPIGRVGALAAALGIGLMIVTSPGAANADSGSSTSQSSDSASTAGSTPRGESTTGSTRSSTNDTSSASGDEASGQTSTDAGSSSTGATTKADDATDTPDATSPSTQTPAENAVTDSDEALSDSGASEISTAPTEGAHDGVAGSEVVSESDQPTGSSAPAESAAAGTPTTPAVETPAASSTRDANGSDPAPSAAVSAVSSTSGASDVVSVVADLPQPSSASTETSVMPTARQAQDDSVPSAPSAASAAVVEVSPAAPDNLLVGVATFFNSIVTNLLNPFLQPAPNTPDPLTPLVWGLLAWVRRTVFNEAPTIAYDSSKNVQTGQTVTGNIGAVDPEGDTLTYTVTPPATGTFVLDQATGNFTYTPDHINYSAEQQFSFTVTVSDGKTNLLSLLGVSHTDQETIGFAVQPPSVDLTVLTMPDGITKPVNPRYAQDGQSIYFSGTPAAGGRNEIYQINIDGTGANCLTCGLDAPTTGSTNPASPINLQKPVPFDDGSGRVVVLLDNPAPRYAVYEPVGYLGNTTAKLVAIVTPDGGGATLPGLPPGGILDRQREMRPSPDGTHVLFTRIVFGQTGNFQALPIVGALTRNAGATQYDVTDAVVVWPTGEGKQWTPDGKGVVVQGGAFDAGNVDDVMIDLSGETGTELYPGSGFLGIRVTGNLDYDEDIDLSPNMQWIAVGSTRGFEALTPMTRILRPNFLPFYVGAAVYNQYADNQVRNASNQTWAVAMQDDLNGENGIPLFVQDNPATPDVDEGDGWIARSMPSWNNDGTAVTFWESGNGDEHGHSPTDSQIVIANLKYTTSVGEVGDKTTVVNTAKLHALSTYVAKTTPIPATGTYTGVGGGTAVVSDVIDPTTHQTTRTVTYTGYVNEDGLILDGTESSAYGPSQLSVTYLADIAVTDATGANRGSLEANAVMTLLPTQAVTGYITSTLDGDTQSIPDPTKAEAAKTGA